VEKAAGGRGGFQQMREMALWNVNVLRRCGVREGEVDVVIRRTRTENPIVSLRDQSLHDVHPEVDHHSHFSFSSNRPREVTLNAQMNSWWMSVMDRQVPTGNDADKEDMRTLNSIVPDLSSSNTWVFPNSNFPVN
jgi:hypothetical protein